MSRLDRQGGFTLIEVLVALTVMGLGLGAIFQLYGTVFEGNARAEKTTEQHPWNRKGQQIPTNAAQIDMKK